VNIKKIGLILSVLATALSAHAFQISSLSPQGEVARVRQLVVKFDEDAVPFGDPKAPAPVSLSCSDAQASAGSGRWINERQWAFEFEHDLPPGVSCTAQARPDFKSAKGAALTGTTRFKFNTGGPFVQSTRPYSDSRIDEEQFFTLRLSGDATLASVKAHVWCAAEGLGESVPVRLIEGSDRDALLKAQGLNDTAKRAPLSVVTLACNRRLTPSAKVKLVFGKGVATPSGVANAVEKRFDFQVREPFSASFSCERENAQSACLPLRPMRLQFNAPVTRKLAEAIRLKSDQATFKPNLGDADSSDDAEVTGLSFEPLFPEQARMTLSLPNGFNDTSGRPLRNADSFPLSVGTGAMPPLIKFAASPFGIVERFAEPSGITLLPVTLRNVEASLSVKGVDVSPGQVSDLQPKTDADIIAWFAKVRRFDDFTVLRRLAAS
jgi:hypothetical protein